MQATLPGNANAATHAAYSPRLREPRAREIAEAVMSAPHVTQLDEIGAVEIGRLEALIETLDRVIAENGAVNARSGKVRALVDLRLRASRRLGEWLDRYGMTPKGRAEWARDLAAGGEPLGVTMARIAREGNGG